MKGMIVILAEKTISKESIFSADCNFFCLWLQFFLLRLLKRNRDREVHLVLKDLKVEIPSQELSKIDHLRSKKIQIGFFLEQNYFWFLTMIDLGAICLIIKKVWKIGLWKLLLNLNFFCFSWGKLYQKKKTK